MTMRWWSPLVLLGFAVLMPRPGFAQTAPNPATPPATSPSPAPAQAGQSATISGEYLRELKTVEEAVHELKERVFRSKATLELLNELVVEAAALQSEVSIFHVTDLRGGYKIEGVHYFLDGRMIYEWTAGTVPLPREFEVRAQDTEVGPHTLQVAVDLRGDGGSVFNYVEDYVFKVQSSFQFDVEAGRRTLLYARLVRQKGVKKSYVERPTMEYELRTDSGSQATEGEDSTPEGAP